MEKPFPAYEGDALYLFISYSHDDTEAVYPQMTWLDQAGFNLWYDDGIHVGTVWRRALADALSRSAGMVFFCTRQSVDPDNCLKEINFALDDGKPVFVVQLDETPLPAELRLSLSDRQSLRRLEFDETTFRQRLTSALSSVAPPEAKGSSTIGIGDGPVADPPAIALLPFSAISDDREVAYVAEGLTEDLVALVGTIPWVTHAVRAEESKLDSRDIGRQRNVRYLFEGSVRPRAGGYRITSRIVETAVGPVARDQHARPAQKSVRRKDAERVI